jgi:DNA-binding MltR family transcriptional regulator
MDVQEAPRIGNRSDALELMDKIIEEVDNTACVSGFIGTALEALRDAIEREIL